MIASRFREAYRCGMTAMRLVRLFTILALLFAPLSMVSEHAAMAMPMQANAAAHHAESARPADHCADMSGQSEDETVPGRDCMIDCTIACSGIPSVGSVIADQAMPAALDQPLPLVSRIRGLHPESADPPPRIA